jgi:hypothetical protein
MHFGDISYVSETTLTRCECDIGIASARLVNQDSLLVTLVFVHYVQRHVCFLYSLLLVPFLLLLLNQLSAWTSATNISCYSLTYSFIQDHLIYLASYRVR